MPDAQRICHMAVMFSITATGLKNPAWRYAVATTGCDLSYSKLREPTKKRRSITEIRNDR
jgi:hypothetical protein